MRALGVLVLVLLLSLLSNVRAGVDQAADYWIDLTQEIDRLIAHADPKSDVAEQVLARLEKIAPDYIHRISFEGKKFDVLKNVWGRSINFDEGAKAIIVPEPTLDVVLAVAGVPPRGYKLKTRQAGLIAHAGFEHTYGYLLSNLKTPYGYKRERWVRPDIEIGFGIAENTIAPFPKEGGLFSNLTTFAGSIAFASRLDGNRNPQPEDAMSLALVRAASRGAAKAVRAYPYSTLHGRRLLERIQLPAGRVVEIRTDFVPFIHGSAATTGGNSELLIYSIRDTNERFAKLISAFPIAKGFSDNAVDPKGLGSDRPIKTRYNAFVPGVTDSAIPLKGLRTVIEY